MGWNHMLKKLIFLTPFPANKMEFVRVMHNALYVHLRLDSILELCGHTLSQIADRPRVSSTERTSSDKAYIFPI